MSREVQHFCSTTFFLDTSVWVKERVYKVFETFSSVAISWSSTLKIDSEGCLQNASPHFLMTRKHHIRMFLLIHEADPQSRQVVITIFARVVRPSVPTLQNLTKQSSTSCIVRDHYWRDCGSGRVDHCLVDLFVSVKQFIFPKYPLTTCLASEPKLMQLD